MIDEIEMQKRRDTWVRERIDAHARRLSDEADKDYISARMAYRAKFGGQFLWSSLQSIEKYLKCILLLNRISSAKLGHDIKKSLRLVRKKTPCKIEFIHPECEAFIQYVNSVGVKRYGDTKQLADFDHLARLDQTVWSVRRYCQIPWLPVEENISPDDLEVLRKEFFQRIHASSQEPPHKLPFNQKGMLGSTLDRENSFERDALVWQNQCFGEPAEQLELLQMSSLKPGFWDVFDDFLCKEQKSYPQLYEAMSSLIFIPDGLKKEIEERIERNSAQD